jgi:glycine/serine hydroxymethyltransferase
MRDVGELIVESIRNREDEAVKQTLKERVREICARFPVPGLTQA